MLACLGFYLSVRGVWMRRLCLLASLVVPALFFLTSCGSSSSSSSGTRTVTVNWINTYWGPSGQTQVPASASAAVNIEAMVPQSDGSITLLKGSATSTPGVFVIPNVPKGNYWLYAGGGPFWTNTSTFDAGSDIAMGYLQATTSSSTTTVDYNISGVATESTDEYVSVTTEPQTDYSFGLVDLPAGTATLAEGFGMNFYYNWPQTNNIFVAQYEPETLGSLDNYVMGPELTLSNVPITAGVTNTISGTLNPASNTSLTLSVSGQQWASAFSSIGPATFVAEGSVLTLAVEPYVSGANVSGTNLPLVAPTPADSTFYQTQTGYVDVNSRAISCQEPTGLVGTVSTTTTTSTTQVQVLQPPILTNQNFGALQYGDPFDSTWTRALSFCQYGTVPIPVPDSTATASFFVEAGESVAPSNSPLTPIALPVQSPTIEGASFYSSSTINTTMPTLSWTAPSGTSPYGYQVRDFVLTMLNNAPAYQSIVTYNTAATSVTLPPLAGGNTYVFEITTLVDGVANMQTSPHRSALPTGFASVVSAPITISAAAPTPSIDGDIEEWNNLVKPKQNVSATGDVSCTVHAAAGVRAVCEPAAGEGR
jgi:hypothetical protein